MCPGPAVHCAGNKLKQALLQSPNALPHPLYEHSGTSSTTNGQTHSSLLTTAHYSSLLTAPGKSADSARRDAVPGRASVSLSSVSRSALAALP
eukprot:scaffold4848_cov59-Phaeocystis_antarctica.AAC.2